MGKEKVLERRLIQERVRALATMRLMGRSDLAVDDAQPDCGFDLVVTIRAGQKAQRRQFGVELRGRWAGASNKREVDQVLRPSLAHLKRFSFVMPVCVFFFTMKDNAGWYFWAAEPVVTPGNLPKLPMAAVPDSHSLDGKAIDGIVDCVNRWYDALHADLSAPLK